MKRSDATKKVIPGTRRRIQDPQVRSQVYRLEISMNPKMENK